MNRKNLIAIAFVLVTLIIGSVANANLFSDVKSSDLTAEQKTELYTMIRDGEKDEAEAKFETYQAAAELAAEAKSAQLELEKTWTAEVAPDSMSYDICIDDWCDSGEKAVFLAKRWNLDLPEDWTDGPDMTEIRVILHNAVDDKLAAKQATRVANLEEQNARQQRQINRVYARTAKNYDLIATNALNIETLREELNVDRKVIDAALGLLADKDYIDDPDDYSYMLPEFDSTPVDFTEEDESDDDEDDDE